MKSFLQRVFSIISLFFCTMSIASALNVSIADGRIIFQSVEEKCDIRNGKNKNNPIKVKLKSINESIINEILNDFQLKSWDANNLIPIGDDFVTDIYENKRPNITFYEYFRVNNVNYQVSQDDNGDFEKELNERNIDIRLDDNYNDFMKNKDENYYGYKFNLY